MRVWYRYYTREKTSFLCTWSKMFASATRSAALRKLRAQASHQLLLAAGELCVTTPIGLHVINPSSPFTRHATSSCFWRRWTRVPLLTSARKMGWSFPSLTLILSGVFVAWILNSMWTIYGIFNPASCEGGNECLNPSWSENDLFQVCWISVVHRN